MDRFVTRTPTWKTLNYSSMAAQQKKCVTKKTPADKKKPLQERQISEVSPLSSYNFDRRVVDLLHTSSQPTAENFNGNSNDSGLSSASSVSPKIDDNACDYNAISNKNLLSPVKNHSGKLADYIDCPVEKENDTYMTIARTPVSQEKEVDISPQVHKPLEAKQVNTPVNKSSNRLQPLANNMIMARIQRDLNSPSAAARVKAIKALKSPTKSAYNHFDIPDAEQSLRLPDPPSLQEIMRNIIVYVEVRSGEDNRSAGVRKVIEALGARVTLSLNRETTHVVFKDGLLSTFKKATQMNIPIVSILWIEACKNERRICDPKNFPISNLDRYVNPELYTKMKRVKCMQPDSECNKRIRAKAGGTPKDSTPTQKTGYQKKTSTFIGGTPTSSKCKQKTDISQFFRKIEEATPTSAFKEDSKITGTKTIQESPKTPLPNRFHSECYKTTLNDSKKKTGSRQKIKDVQHNSDDSSSATKQILDAKKSLNFIQVENAEEIIESSIRNNIVVEMQSPIEPSPITKLHERLRSCSLVKECELETATNSMNTMQISSPIISIRNRRSSTHTAKDMSVVFKESSSKVNSIQPILEESNESEKIQVFSSKSVNERKTIYATKTMDQTDLAKSENNTKVESTNATRRRTLYTVKTIEISEIKGKINNKHLSNASNRRRTCLNPTTLEQTQILEITDDKAKTTPDSELVDNSKSIDLTNEVERNTKPSKMSDKATNSRRTLCGGHKICETNKTTLQTSSPNSTTGLSVSQTPINFQTRRVASSTLLDDSENISKLVTTPSADATTGKLLEETEQCHTPLVFSSTRRPGNSRRSLFDVSMDIITQRLQCINQSARRSLAPPTPSADVVNALEKSISKPPVDIEKSEKSDHLLNSTTPKTSTEALNDNTNNNNGTTDGLLLPTTNTSKTKRKLFMPNEMPPLPSPAPSILSIKAVETFDKRDVTKRRRTLMPISQPQSTTTTTVSHNDSTTSIGSTPKVKKRRSTLDFEQIQNDKPKAVNSVKNSSSAASVKANSNQKQLNAKKAPVLVYTNMHQQQIDVIREAINKLGIFVLENSVTNATTHLVSLEPRRTLNLLRALTRGCWILDYSWISESLAAGRWLPEESHELKSFSKAVELCRSEHQAFGNAYKCELFRKIGAFYISSQCCPLNKENMRELITLCGGRVVNNRQKARYIIGDNNRTLEDKLYLTPFWVLDCITQMQIMKVNKYMYSLSEGKSASSKSIPLQEKAL